MLPSELESEEELESTLQHSHPMGGGGGGVNGRKGDCSPLPNTKFSIASLSNLKVLIHLIKLSPGDGGGLLLHLWLPVRGLVQGGPLPGGGGSQWTEASHGQEN